MKKNLSRPYGSLGTRKSRPDISIEWLDVNIEIKLCSPDIPPDERKFVSLYPVLDPSLMDVLDDKKDRRRSDRCRAAQYEYVSMEDSDEDQLPNTVLPKLSCTHCGKTFSRQSTLDQHMVTHSSSTQAQTWEEVQDAAIQDLEQDILYGTDPSLLTLTRQTKLLQQRSDEEEEISPPEDLEEVEEEEEVPVMDEKKEVEQPKPKMHECNKCHKSFSRVSLLNRHMKLHLGIKPYQCNVCGWRFLQSYNLKKHVLTHGRNSLRCSQCKATFSEQSKLKEHVLVKHNQGMPGHSNSSALTHQQPQSPKQPTIQYFSKGGQQIYPCHHCDKVFMAQASLLQHLQYHRK